MSFSTEETNQKMKLLLRQVYVFHCTNKCRAIMNSSVNFIPAKQFKFCMYITAHFLRQMSAVCVVQYFIICLCMKIHACSLQVPYKVCTVLLIMRAAI